MLFYLSITVFVVVMIAAWSTNFVGMPGNWVMLGASIVWTFFSDEKSASHIGWQLLVAFGVLAVIGEVVEFLASVLGTKKMGGSRKAAACSVVGSVIGSMIGAFVGLPIPVPLVGMVIGSVLFACVGALVGAVAGERWEGSKMDKSLKVGGAAFAGRFVGTTAKITMGAAILVIAIVSLFV